MAWRIFSLALAFVVLTALVFAELVDSHPYESEEAYEIYDQVIPRTDTYVFSKDTLVVELQTSQQPDVNGACFTKEVSNKFAEAIADLGRQQKAKWLLQPRFHIAKPVRLVSSEKVHSLLGEGQSGWSSFFEQYPGAGGYISLGPVGFNHDKTLAVVHVASRCRSPRYEERFRLWQKDHGYWREIAGSSCSGGS